MTARLRNDDAAVDWRESRSSFSERSTDRTCLTSSGREEVASDPAEVSLVTRPRKVVDSNLADVSRAVRQRKVVKLDPADVSCVARPRGVVESDPAHGFPSIVIRTCFRKVPERSKRPLSAVICSEHQHGRPIVPCNPQRRKKLNLHPTLD